jgi:ribosomal protein L13E
MVQNGLPGFWSPDLSRAYSGSNLIEEMHVPKKMSREEKIKWAKQLRGRGFSYGEIARVLGISKSTANNCIDNYPYRR